jgi:hypothetical protein
MAYILSIKLIQTYSKSIIEYLLKFWLWSSIAVWKEFFL